MALRVNLRVSLDGTFWGRTGVGLARALVHEGLNVSLTPERVQTPLPMDIAHMLTVEPEAPFDLSIHVIDPLAVAPAEPNMSYRTLLWTAHGGNTFTSEHAALLAPVVSGVYSHVLAYDTATESAYKALGTQTPVSSFQGGYEPDEWIPDGTEKMRDWGSDEFVFCISGDLSAPRKRVHIAAQAVQTLADEGLPVRLRIKTHRPDAALSALVGAHSAAELFVDSWPQKTMKAFYSAAHAFVGPSSDEGLNLDAVEAGTTGAALVLSDCDGHRRWARPEFAHMVPLTQTDFTDACRKLVTDRSVARRMGDMASRTIPPQLSWHRVVRDLMQNYSR